MKAYAGIGSRTTPDNILKDMEQFAHLAAPYLILRSGAAQGADAAFELGCNNANGVSEIYLPWKNFMDNKSELHHIGDKAHELASEIHPHYQYMKRASKLLVARNMYQILGERLNNPVDFVMCWTPDGCESHETYGLKTGGTGSAIALASRLDIPVYNLFNSDRLIDAYERLLQNKVN